MRLLEPDLTCVLKPAESQTHIPDFLDARGFGSFDDVGVFFDTRWSVSLGAGHEKEIFHVCESGFQRFGPLEIGDVELYTLGLEAGSVRFRPGSGDDG